MTSRRTGRKARGSPPGGGAPAQRPGRRPPPAARPSLWARLRQPWRPWVVALVLACLSCGVYCANGRSMPIGDTIPAALTPIELITHGSLDMSAYYLYYRQHHVVPHFFLQTRNHGFISAYPILTGLVLVPFYVIPVRLFDRGQPRTEDWVQFAVAAGKISAAVIAAAAVAVFYLLALRLGASRRWAVALALAQAFATEAWSTSSQALWQHGLGVLTILIACLLALRQAEGGATVARAFGFGLACAMAVAARPTNLVFAVPLFLWTVLRPAARRTAVLLASAAAPVLVGCALVAYNVLLLRGLGGGYRWVWSPSALPALAGLLFSPGRGLLIYCPLLLLGFAGVARAVRGGAFTRSLYFPLALFVAAHLLLVACFANWWGGYCFGPRQLTEIQPILLLLAIPLLAAPGWLLGVSFWVLFGWSVVMQAFGAFLYTGYWNAQPKPVDYFPERLWDWVDNPVARDLAMHDWRSAPAPKVPLEQWAAAYRPPPVWRLHAGENARIDVVVTNLSMEAWANDAEQSGYGAVLLSYRLYDPQGRRVPGERVRTRLGEPIGPDESVHVHARVEAPAVPGHYRVAFTLVQEGVAWFDNKGVGPGNMDLDVLPAAGMARPPTPATPATARR